MAEPTIEKQIHRSRPAPILRLGNVLHRISHVKIVFYLLGMYFQARTMFFGDDAAFIANLNTMLLMYGIAMSFESFRDNEKISETERRWYLGKPALWFLVLAMLFGGGLLAMAVGFLVFMLRQNDELGWGITTFGLGIIALGRQQYDQYVQVLAGAGALRGLNAPESPPDAV